MSKRREREGEGGVVQRRAATKSGYAGLHSMRVKKKANYGIALRMMPAALCFADA